MKKNSKPLVYLLATVAVLLVGAFVVAGIPSPVNANVMDNSRQEHMTGMMGSDMEEMHDECGKMMKTDSSSSMMGGGNHADHHQ